MNEEYFWLKQTENLWFKACIFFGFFTCFTMFICMYFALPWWLTLILAINVLTGGYYAGHRHKKAKIEAAAFLKWQYPRWFIQEKRDSGIYNYKATKFNPQMEMRGLYYKYTDVTDGIYYLPLYTDTNILEDEESACFFYDQVRERLPGIAFPKHGKAVRYSMHEVGVTIATNNVVVTVVSNTTAFALSMAILKVLLHEQEFHKVRTIHDLRALPPLEKEPEEEPVDNEAVEQLLTSMLAQLSR